jgi:hypothetical protein
MMKKMTGQDATFVNNRGQNKAWDESRRRRPNKWYDKK